MTKNSSSNRAVVPEAKGALDRFKFEVANELGVSKSYAYKVDVSTEKSAIVCRIWGIKSMYSLKNVQMMDMFV